MARCRDAIREGKWADLADTVHKIAAKARRVIVVARAQVGTARPQDKRTLEAAVERTERGRLYRSYEDKV